MTSSIQIICPSNPQEVPFQHLTEMLLAAFAAQDGIVNPPSSAKSVTVSELQWRFARDRLFLATDEVGTVVGQVWVEDTGRDAYLYKLSVDTAIQRGGIGRALVTAACEDAAGRGKEKMRLHVRVELTDNVAYFKSRGFEIVGEGMHDGYDHATFWKMARDLDGMSRP